MITDFITHQMLSKTLLFGKLFGSEILMSVFLNANISQGSVATCLKCGEIFSNHLIAMQINCWE